MIEETILPAGEIHLAGPPSRQRLGRHGRKPTGFVGLLLYGLIRLVIKGILLQVVMFAGSLAVVAAGYFFWPSLLSMIFSAVGGPADFDIPSEAINAVRSSWTELKASISSTIQVPKL